MTELHESRSASPALTPTGHPEEHCVEVGAIFTFAPYPGRRRLQSVHGEPIRVWIRARDLNLMTSGDISTIVGPHPGEVEFDGDGTPHIISMGADSNQDSNGRVIVAVDLASAASARQYVPGWGLRVGGRVRTSTAG